MRKMRIEDRTVIMRFDVSDGDGVCDRYHLTTANTVVHEQANSELVREHSFPNMLQGMAFIIEQTGCAEVVDNLLAYSANDTVRNEGEQPSWWSRT